tara:strand:- start:430 stop:1449 length:1020 start_codon:yes stop_codon:yes gene_type:complete
MSDAWNSQVDAMADTIEEMVRSGKGEVSDFRNTANDTIAKVGGALPENIRNSLHSRLNSRLDKLEAEINAKIDHAASIAVEESKQALDGAMMQFIQTMKGLPADELTQLFSFIDKDSDGVINQDEFGQFVATTLPPGTVIPPAAIALGFQVLDTDRTGTLSVSDILGTKGEVITTTAKIVAEEMKQEPEPEIQTPEPEIQTPEPEVIEQVETEEVVLENDTIKENESASIFDSADIASQLSQARFSSEKTKIIESMKGNPVEFNVTINRIRTEAGPNRPMEVEVSATDGSDYIISIDTSKISSIPNAIENGKGTAQIKGSVLGFNMARNCVTIDISGIE